MNKSLLIELGTEELPPMQQQKLAANFADFIKTNLASQGISSENIKTFAAPRRLAVILDNIPDKLNSKTITKRGPALSACYDQNQQPTKAALGFAKANNLDIKDCEILKTDKGEWLIANVFEAGKNLADILPNIIEAAIKRAPFSKTMRWADFDLDFVRPIHWICIVHGNDALKLPVFHLKSDNLSYGDRFFCEQPIIISNAEQYSQILLEHKVMPSFNERKAAIKQQAQKIAQKLKASAIIEDDLLTEVAGLNEWPTVHLASFDRSFLSVPKEALISSMQDHQKCFALEDSQANLLPNFLLTSNIPAANPENIISGNEKVMRARLEDAKFFFEQDKKIKLKDRVAKLKHVTFQHKLGSIFDKITRVTQIADNLNNQFKLDPNQVSMACQLYKADLVTDMVFEFPELQGIMGYYYALNDGHDIDTAIAIKESYYPRFASDDLPTTQLGIILALSDRIDSLSSIFSINLIPTGDKDPFALRRQALGAIRICVEKDLDLDLLKLANINNLKQETSQKLLAFFQDRLKSYLEEKARPQTLQAVLAVQTTSFNPLDLQNRVLAIENFSNQDYAQDLAAANKRVQNILTKNKISLSDKLEVNSSIFAQEQEKSLFEQIENLEASTKPLINAKDYNQALVQLSTIKPLVNDFFDNVMVMDKDAEIKQNRVAILQRLANLFLQIADISKLVI